MKKIEVETECGEVSVIYVSQDVSKITVDGEEYGVTPTPEPEDTRLPAQSERGIYLRDLMVAIEAGIPQKKWVVDYIVGTEKIVIWWGGADVPRNVFKV